MQGPALSLAYSKIMRMLGAENNSHTHLQFAKLRMRYFRKIPIIEKNFNHEFVLIVSLMSYKKVMERSI